MLGSSYHSGVCSSAISRSSLPRLLLLIATPQTLDPNAQDGSIYIQDILASFLESRLKWKRVNHLYIQLT